MSNTELYPTPMDDLDNIMTWINDPEVTAYFAWKKNITREDEKNFLESLLQSKEDFVYSILDDEDGYVGQCSINKIYWPAGNGRIFLAIKKEFQGKGYAQKVIAKLLNIAFEVHNLHKIWLIVRKDNEKGRYLYKKCGFEVEGYLRDEYRVNGQYIDMVRMSITKDEYLRWYK